MARWEVRMAADAARDFAGIMDYTLATFGDKQAKIYERTLTSAMNALRSGPIARGSASREDILPGL